MGEILLCERPESDAAFAFRILVFIAVYERGRVICVLSPDRSVCGYSESVEYTVTFVVEGVKEIQIVKGGEKADKPEDPVKPGYIFIGWYIGNEQYLFNVVKSDIEVEAKFSKIVLTAQKSFYIISSKGMSLM